MNIPILIQPIAGDGYLAKSGEPLPLRAQGATRDEAMRNLRELIDRQLQNGTEIVSLELPGAENPWLAMAGMYDPNDPVVQEWIEIMAENRRKMDEDPNIP
jgi:predicted RNase H-like HicB family nuclease